MTTPISSAASGPPAPLLVRTSNYDHHWYSPFSSARRRFQQRGGGGLTRNVTNGCASIHSFDDYITFCSSSFCAWVIDDVAMSAATIGKEGTSSMAGRNAQGNVAIITNFQQYTFQRRHTIFLFVIENQSQLDQLDKYAEYVDLVIISAAHPKFSEGGYASKLLRMDINRRIEDHFQFFEEIVSEMQWYHMLENQLQ